MRPVCPLQHPFWLKNAILTRYFGIFEGFSRKRQGAGGGRHRPGLGTSGLGCALWMQLKVACEPDYSRCRVLSAPLGHHHSAIHQVSPSLALRWHLGGVGSRAHSLLQSLLALSLLNRSSFPGSSLPRRAHRGERNSPPRPLLPLAKKDAPLCGAI